MSFDQDYNSEQPPKKLKLRRLGLQKIEQEVIKKNLEPLKHHVEKKKRAQEIYYERNFQGSGTSPLNRNFYRRPVKQRLGGVPLRGTNTSDILPKIRLRKLNNGTSNNVIRTRKLRVNGLQQRLYNIRGMCQTSMLPQSTPNRIKIRRSIPNNFHTPQNFKVEVRNNNAVYNRTFKDRRFRQILNQQIKNEIRNLQNEFRDVQRYPLMNITPVATKLKLNERFATLI